MPGLLGSARAAAAGLAAFVALLLVLRARSCVHRSEARLYALLLALVTIRILMPGNSAAAGPLSFLLLWAAGLHSWTLAGQRPRSGSWMWHLWTAAGALVASTVILIGYWGTVPARLLYGCAYASLVVFALVYYFRSLRRGTHGLRLGGALSAHGGLLAAVLGSAGLQALAPRSPVVSLAVAGAGIAFLASCGYLMAHEGYLQGGGGAGELREGGGSASELRAVRARMEATESSLLLLDRLVATSLLSAGTAHEFKGVLSGILTSAEHGLRRADDASSREILGRILDHARQGERTVLRYLDELVRFGREEVRPVDLRRDLDEVFRLLRSSCRRQGVNLAVCIDEEVVVQVRPGEITQVLLNLARNALAALELRSEGRGAPELSVRARRWEGEALLEIADNGPGIDAVHVGGLFEPGGSGRESTGLGLYLSRMLVERNGGTLEYVPVDQGGCFRIVLPLAEDS